MWATGACARDWRFRLPARATRPSRRLARAAGSANAYHRPSKALGTILDVEHDRTRQKHFFTVEDSVEVVQSARVPRNPRREFSPIHSSNICTPSSGGKPTMTSGCSALDSFPTGHLSPIAARIHPTLRHARSFDAGRTLNNHKMSARRIPVLGPFYIANAPRYENGANICLDGKAAGVGRGPRDRRRRTPHRRRHAGRLAANEDGFYDVQQKGVQPDMNLRASSPPTPTSLLLPLRQSAY